MEESYLVVLTAFPNQEVARQIGTLLVESKLVACVNLFPQVESIYQWQGTLMRDQEVIGVMKTTQKSYKNLEVVLLDQHPYEVPEIIAIDVKDGSEKYLSWVSAHVAMHGGAPPKKESDQE